MTNNKPKIPESLLAKLRELNGNNIEGLDYHVSDEDTTPEAIKLDPPLQKVIESSRIPQYHPGTTVSCQEVIPDTEYVVKVRVDESVANYGIHARNAVSLVTMLTAYSARNEIFVSKIGSDQKQVPAHSILGLMTLEAYPGSILDFYIKGPDAQVISDKLQLAAQFGFGDSKHGNVTLEDALTTYDASRTSPESAQYQPPTK